MKLTSGSSPVYGVHMKRLRPTRERLALLIPDAQPLNS
jgi:hypothetical protein